jgi:hypothetical protein
MEFLQNGDYIEFVSAINPEIVTQGFFIETKMIGLLLVLLKIKKREYAQKI